MMSWGLTIPARVHCAALSLFVAIGVFPTLGSAADSAAPAASDAPDKGALVRELTLSRDAAGKLTVTMWLPDEFWRTSLQNSGSLTGAGIDKIIAIMHPYVLIGVLDAQKGITAFRYTDLDTLVGEITIEDSHGERYSPLAPEAVSEEVRNFIQAMRPLLANMMGAMGQHMEFLVFANADKAGHPIADPKVNGSLTVNLGDAAMRYRLPLASLLPPSLDPKTGDSFPGSYRFNPYTGDKLVQRAPSNPATAAKKPQ
jgi:hypothetical protein